MKREFGIAAIILAVLVVAGTTLSFAQQKQGAGERVWVERQGMKEPQPPAPGDVPFEFNREVQGPDGPPPPGIPGDFVFIASELNFGGRVVKGAPYSAQAVTETIQTLADGNRIVNKSTAAVYRDGEGRMRREQTFRAIGGFANSGEAPQTIVISNPVDDTSYILDPYTRIAQKMPPMSFTFQFKAPAPPGDKANLQPGSPQLDRVERRQIETGRTDTAKGSSDLQPGPPLFDREQHQIEMARVDLAANVGSERNFIWGLGNHVPTEEALGKQNVEGVEAEGTRSVMTIPAGEIGNERPIEIISERWYSSELQAVIMTRHSDPRFGESTYRLTNIDRSEPARSLFEVPADYKVKSGPMGQGGGIGFGTGGGIGGSDVVTFHAGGASGGSFLNGKATSLPLPQYPAVARTARASGDVVVEVTINEEGNVVAAKAVSGHPLLRPTAVAAARKAKFAPTKVSGEVVKVQGVLIYTFVDDSVRGPKDNN